MSVYKYRMLVEARTDLTPEEIEQRNASQFTRNAKLSNPIAWPWRDTGEIIHARRRQTACAFYRALRQIKPIIKIRAVKINEEPRSARRDDDIQLRAWRGFDCLSGCIAGIGDEVKHFAVPDELSDGRTACGLRFTEYWTVNGKPECDKCLAAAVDKHPEMQQYL